MKNYKVWYYNDEMEYVNIKTTSFLEFLRYRYLKRWVSYEITKKVKRKIK